jgi:Na+-transporting NADH:ubiquinone oxidoreductase subunit C
MNRDGTIYTVIFIFIVSFAFVFLLSLTNGVTAERVELNREVTRQGAVLSAMGIEASGADEIQTRYQLVRADLDAGLYVAAVGDETVYGLQVDGPGLWGTIEGILAVTSDLSEIVGIEILSDNETPGLGGRINEDWFKEQFRGEAVSAGSFRVVDVDGEGDTDAGNNQVDAVTGATRTSDSIEAIVNRALETLREPGVREILSRLESGGADT